MDRVRVWAASWVMVRARVWVRVSVAKFGWWWLQSNPRQITWCCRILPKPWISNG